ncbi:MAG: TatD family hydrolase [Paludibacteraceae bacterium]|nr:TatD family hydrolase [Paludibacteraceae bacterium]
MIDTHAHIDDEQYQDNLDEFIRTQQEAGVEAILVPGVDETNIEAVWQVCQQYPGYLYPAIGLHPENVGTQWQDQLAAIHTQLYTAASSKLKYTAIGEIGLDYHFDTTYKAEQQAALRQQLTWAMDLDLPVMLHVRDATEDALTILKEYTNPTINSSIATNVAHQFINSHEYGASIHHSPRLRGVMHCWSGSEEVARQIVDMGLYLGIGGIITFKNCKLREHLSSIPLERLVLETDAPYMAPVPHRGERNESRWIAYVMEELSRIYGVTPAEIDRITTQNAKTLFGIKI